MQYCSICRGRGRIYAGGRWVRCGNCNKRPTKQEQETYMRMNRQPTQEELENIRANALDSDHQDV